MKFFKDPWRDAVTQVTRMRSTDYLFTIVTVLRLRLIPDGTCMILPEDEQPGARLPEYFDDGLGASPIFAGDYAPFKPRTDVTLMGRGYAPQGRRTTTLQVTFGVDNWRKSLDIIGDRLWLWDTKLDLSAPEPFESVALRMENAFGGVGSTYNPWGKGFGKIGELDDLTLPACNIHPEGVHHVRWDSDIPAAGFGPLPADFLPRSALRGTYDEAWLFKRNPLPPEDFEWGFYNSAPADQQFFPYLTGDETFYFENLHPKYARFTSQMHDQRVRIIVRRRLDSDGQIQFEELRSVLDSVHIDTDRMTVDLAWRAVASTLDPEAADITHCYIATEPLAEMAKPLSSHVTAFEDLLRPRPRTPPPAPPEPPPQSTEDLAENELEAVAALKNMVRELPLPPKLKDAVEDADTSTEINSLLDEALEAYQKVTGNKIPPFEPG